jgi:hypothetical protein
MNEELLKKVNIFIIIETTCSEIYTLLDNLCPDRKGLWHYLSKIEKNHATVAVIAKRYCEQGKLNEDFLPGSLSEMIVIQGSAIDLKNRIKDNNISLADALKGILSLEEASCEIYCKELEAKETSSEAFSNLQKILVDTHAHVKFLRDFINNKKYL